METLADIHLRAAQNEGNLFAIILACFDSGPWVDIIYIGCCLGVLCSGLFTTSAIIIISYALLV